MTSFVVTSVVFFIFFSTALHAADVYNVDPTKGTDKPRRFYGIGGLSGGGACTVVLLFATLVLTSAGPAPDIYDLRILGCWCTSGTLYCRYRQMGYGNVYKRFSSGSVSCSESRRIVDASRIIIGWEYDCRFSTTSGQFEISTAGGRICGRSYDRYLINNCSGRRQCLG